MNLQTWQRTGLLAVVGLVAFFVAAATLVSSLRWIHKPFPGFFLYANLAVGPDFLSEWSGSKEGLRFLDRVVSVGGQRVTQRGQIYDLVRKAPLGTPFRYSIEREGRRFDIMVPSMQFSFYDWLLSYGAYLLAGLGFLLIGFAPFHFRSTAPAATPLFFMVSAIFLWFTATFDFMTSQFFPREIRVFALSATPSAGIHLGLSLSGRAKTRRWRLSALLAVYAISGVLGSLYLFSFHRNVALWQAVLRLTYGYSCLAALIFLGLLWTELQRGIPELERFRLRVVFFGAILGFFLPTLGTVLASSFQWEIPYNLLLIPAVFFPLSVAYALLKYNLFDLDQVLKVGLTRGALSGTLLLLYVLLVYLVGSFAGGYEEEPLVPVFFSFLVVIIFNPLLRWIEGLMDRYLFRREYDPLQLQSEVGSLLKSLSSPQETGKRFSELIQRRIGVEKISLFFRSPDEGTYLAGPAGEDEGVYRESATRLQSLWLCRFGADKKGISRDEVAADPSCVQDREGLLEIFGSLKAELLISMEFEANPVGFIALGRKLSGRGYDGEDFRVLCVLSDQLALSLQNGALFEESERTKESYRLLYDQSQALNERLVEVDQQKKQFVANISHELRTPISTILGYGEVLLDPNFKGDARGVLERVVTNGQELSRLMDSLLDFSRIETGSMTVDLQEVNVREMLQSLEIMARRLIKGRPIRFWVEIDPLLEVIETDPKKLQQILMQLLTNAVKFTQRGEIAVEIKSGSTSDGCACVAISVSDTGIGISKPDQEVIFEEFRQLDGSSTRQYGGTGLGLGLCRKLVRSLGGTIEVDSEVGRGSVFNLILPFRSSRLAASAAGLAAS